MLWFIGVAALGAGLVATTTWGVVPWNWRFPAFYLALAFVTSLVVRFRSSHLENFVQTLILCGTLPLVFSWFFGERWTEGAAPLHLGAVAVFCVMVGLGLAMWVRPPVAKARSHGP
jgi:hypothetical protein